MNTEIHINLFRMVGKKFILINFNEDFREKNDERGNILKGIISVIEGKKTLDFQEI